MCTELEERAALIKQESHLVSRLARNNVRLPARPRHELTQSLGMVWNNEAAQRSDGGRPKAALPPSSFPLTLQTAWRDSRAVLINARRLSSLHCLFVPRHSPSPENFPFPTSGAQSQVKRRNLFLKWRSHPEQGRSFLRQKLTASSHF